MKVCQSCGRNNTDQALFCECCRALLPRPPGSLTPLRRQGWNVEGVVVLLTIVSLSLVSIVALGRWEPVRRLVTGERPIDQPSRVEPSPGQTDNPTVQADSPSAGVLDRSRVLAIQDIERRTYDLVNDYRVSIGLPALEYSEALAAIARQHSQAMATGRSSFSHAGAPLRMRAAQDIIRLKTFAENIAFNNAPASRAPRRALSGWLRSKGHRETIEGQFDLTGVGSARGDNGVIYLTQLFVDRQERTER